MPESGLPDALACPSVPLKIVVFLMIRFGLFSRAFFNLKNDRGDWEDFISASAGVAAQKADANHAVDYSCGNLFCFIGRGVDLSCEFQAISRGTMTFVSETDFNIGAGCSCRWVPLISWPERIGFLSDLRAVAFG